MQSFVSLLSFLGLLSTSGVFALPYSVANRELNVTMIQRADASKCASLSVDDAKKMPGWAKLEQYAKDTWGDGGWNIVTNPEDFPDRPASACVEDGNAELTPKGPPQCTTQVIDLSGDTAGTTGEATISYSTTQSTEGSWTVSQSSSFSIGTSFGINIGFEGLFDASSTITTSTTFENSNSRSFSTTSNAMATETVKTNTVDGKHCQSTLDVKTCTQDGEGKVRILASGYVWFNYEDARAPKADPNGGKHFKYSASIDDVLTLDERSSWMTFTGGVKGVSQGNYQQRCD